MRRTLVIALVLVVAVVLVLTSLDWFRSLARTLTTPVAPVANATTRTQGFFASLREIGTLRGQLAELEARNAELNVELQTLREVFDRDERLQAELLETVNVDQDQLVTARVIGRSPMRAFDSLIVNHGSSDNVAVGQPVTKSGFLVGVVTEVGSSTSTITLLTSSRTILPVLLQTSRAQGILRGGLKGLVVTDLPIDVAVAEGEAVLTSALGDILPADLPIGRTGAVVSAESEILQRVTLSSPIKFATIEEVVIMRSQE